MRHLAPPLTAGQRAAFARIECCVTLDLPFDVAAVEPLPEGSPLWDAPNIHISAHCSSDPSRLFDGTHRIFADNLARYLAGEPLLHEMRAQSCPQPRSAAPVTPLHEMRAQS